MDLVIHRVDDDIACDFPRPGEEFSLGGVEGVSRRPHLGDDDRYDIFDVFLCENTGVVLFENAFDGRGRRRPAVGRIEGGGGRRELNHRQRVLSGPAKSP